MHLIERFRALWLTGGARPLSASGRLPAALALGLGCGAPNDPGATETASGQVTTDDASTGPTTGPTTSGSATGTEATTGGPTTSAEATTGAAGSCALLCARMSACSDEVSLEPCVADCEAADDGLRACLVACDQAECPDLQLCTTACASPGDPDATPYANCEDGSATCQPGVYFCIASAYEGLETEFTACSPFCDDEGNCPAPETGDATPVCDLGGTPALCSLDCSEGEQCPDDMVCDPGGRCMWPVG